MKPESDSNKGLRTCVLYVLTGFLVATMMFAPPYPASPCLHMRRISLFEWIKAVILGVVEGITEFLPISSTGHLIVFSALLNFQTNLQVTFQIFIQIGAVIAVAAFYREELLRQLRTVITDPCTRRLWLNIVVAILPAALVGFAVKSWVTTNLFNSAVVGVTLIVGGLIMLLVERRFGHDNGDNTAITSVESLQTVTLRQAFIVGLAQMIALIPGMSRSASSIIGGLIAGMSRSTATKFSFFLALPTLGGVTLIELISNLDQITPNDFGLLLVGTLVSALVAWYSIRWLLRYVARHTFVAFGYYRIIAGIIILLLVFSGILSITP